MRSGVLIIDNSCLKHLESSGARERLLANARAADWEIWGTAINALEILKHENAGVRERLLGTLRWLASPRGLLPWPDLLLRRAAEAIAARRPGYRSGLSGMEGLLDPTLLVEEESRRKASTFLEERIKAFDDLHERARPQVQEFLRERDLKDAWTSGAQFLDEMWMTPGHIDDYLIRRWSHLGMGGDAPVEALRADEVWRLYFEVYGIAAFERAVTSQRKKRVHLPDLLQLIYLGGNRRRLVASEDKSFMRAANVVLRGRYLCGEAVSVFALIS